MSGYGESKRRRDRDAGRSPDREKRPKDSHRHRRDDEAAPQGKKESKEKDKKDKKEPKEHKEHKERKADRQDDRRDSQRKADRSRSRDRAQATDKGAPDEALLGRTQSKREFNEPTEQKRAWREEMDSRKAREEEDEDAPADGVIPMEDDDDVDAALAASRARREALIARWVNKGEDENGNTGTLETPDTAMGEGGGSSESEGEGENANRDEEVPKEEQTEEEINKQKDLMRFILEQKGEHDGDMFGEGGDEEALNALKVAKDKSAAISQTGASAEDWNDHEGYYKAKIGEIMADRYLVTEDTCGKGVFSNVVKAKDQENGEMVAIKVVRANDMMRTATEKEVEVLERLNKQDKANKKHVIKLLRKFEYRGHLCLVFECMWDNLRVANKKYTKDKGMSLQACRAYTRQLMIALRHIHRSSIVHADIKPDNILISAGHNVVKICDLGSALYLTEVEITPYLVSRFYRAPEITLGMKYGCASDVFAMGATLFELFTGKIMFPGKSNNDMVKKYMDFKGKVPHKFLKSGQFYKKHFNENLDFQYQDVDKMTRKKILRTITDCSAKKSIVEMALARVGPEKVKSSAPEDVLYIKKVKQFAELLGQMTALDPEKRITAHDALLHPFLTEAGPGSKPKEPVKGGQQGHQRR